MMPSFRPSMASQASMVAFVSSASLAGGMIGLPSGVCVASHECM